VHVGRLRAGAAVAKRPIPPPLDPDVYGDKGDGPPPRKNRRRHREKKKRRRGAPLMLPMSGLFVPVLRVSRRWWYSALPSIWKLMVDWGLQLQTWPHLQWPIPSDTEAPLLEVSVSEGRFLDGGVLSAVDLDVVWKYHIPNRKKGGWLH
jgi:hypothetical protein